MKCEAHGCEMEWRGDMLTGGMHCAVCEYESTRAESVVGWDKASDGVEGELQYCSDHLNDRKVWGHQLGCPANSRLTLYRYTGRKWQKLTEEAQDLYDLHILSGNNSCYCSVTYPPCGWCTDEGNPLNLEQDDNYWEDVK